MAFLRNIPARGEPLHCGETGGLSNLVTFGPNTSTPTDLL